MAFKATPPRPIMGLVAIPLSPKVAPHAVSRARASRPRPHHRPHRVSHRSGHGRSRAPSPTRRKRRRRALRNLHQDELEARTAASRPDAGSPRAISGTRSARRLAHATRPPSSPTPRAAAWIGLAAALLAIKPIPTRVASATTCRSTPPAPPTAPTSAPRIPAMKARALAVLADAMQRRSYWRPAIDALKSEPRPRRERARCGRRYEKLRAEHGFRMADYKIDGDAATPRLCMQFSERLARGQIDFAKFVSVNGKDPQTVSAEDQPALHRRPRARPALRGAGARRPAVGRQRGAAEARRARRLRARPQADRCASPGKNYVLPSRGQQGIPLVTVNTGKVDVEVYRIGDRSLANAISNGDFDASCQGYELEAHRRAHRRAASTRARWTSPPKLNEDVTTAFPVSDAIGALQPGVYVMIAQPDASKSRRTTGADRRRSGSSSPISASRRSPATTACTPSCARSPAAMPVADANVAPDRPQQRGAGHRQDRRQRLRALRAGPHARRRRPGAGHARRRERRRRLRLPRPDDDAFDLTDRGVKGRDAPGPLDGYRLHRARRLSPRRDGEPHRARARRARARPRPCRRR